MELLVVSKLSATCSDYGWMKDALNQSFCEAGFLYLFVGMWVDYRQLLSKTSRGNGANTRDSYITFICIGGLRWGLGQVPALC